MVSKGWSYPNPIASFPDLGNTVFIALFGLEDLPPHVAIVHNKTMFSLTIRGVEAYQDATRLLRKVWTKKQCALVECKPFGNAELISTTYNSFEALKPGNSCIDPLLLLFKSASEIVPSKPFLHGLLLALSEAGLIKNCYTSSIWNDAFVLADYAQTDIDKRIEKLGS